MIVTRGVRFLIEALQKLFSTGQIESNLRKDVFVVSDSETDPLSAKEQIKFASYVMIMALEAFTLTSGVFFKTGNRNFNLWTGNVWNSYGEPGIYARLLVFVSYEATLAILFGYYKTKGHFITSERAETKSLIIRLTRLFYIYNYQFFRPIIVILGAGHLLLAFKITLLTPLIDAIPMIFWSLVYWYGCLIACDCYLAMCLLVQTECEKLVWLYKEQLAELTCLHMIRVVTPEWRLRQLRKFNDLLVVTQLCSKFHKWPYFSVFIHMWPFSCITAFVLFHSDFIISSQIATATATLAGFSMLTILVTAGCRVNYYQDQCYQVVMMFCLKKTEMDAREKRLWFKLLDGSNEKTSFAFITGSRINSYFLVVVSFTGDLIYFSYPLFFCLTHSSYKSIGNCSPSFGPKDWR